MAAYLSRWSPRLARHLSIGMEAYSDTQPASARHHSRNHGCTIQERKWSAVHTHSHVNTFLQYFVPQYMGCNRSGTHCACHRAIHALTTFFISYAHLLPPGPIHTYTSASIPKYISYPIIPHQSSRPLPLHQVPKQYITGFFPLHIFSIPLASSSEASPFAS